MTDLPWWKYHYKFMPYTEGDPLFQERIDELREDREFDRMIVHYGVGSDLRVDTWYNHRGTIDTGIDVANIKVDPDSYHIDSHKPGRPVYEVGAETNMDLEILGEDGYRVMCEIYLPLYETNLKLESIYNSTLNQRTTVSKLFKIVQYDHGGYDNAYHKLFKACANVKKEIVIRFIKDNPNAAPKDIKNILSRIIDKAIKAREEFDIIARETMKGCTDAVLYNEDCMEIREMYRSFEKDMLVSPVYNYVNIVGETRMDSRIYALSIWTVPHDVEKICKRAWAVETTGFDRWTIDKWPFDINSAEEFVVIAHYLVVNSGSQRIQCKHDHRKCGDSMNTAIDLIAAKKWLDHEYNTCKYKGESGAKQAYDEYMEIFDRLVYCPCIGRKPLSDYVRSSLSVLVERGQKTAAYINALNRDYTAHRKLAKVTRVNVDRDISPYDYGTSIKDMANFIISQSKDSNDSDSGIRGLFTKFTITDETKDDGIALCWIMMDMKNLIQSIRITRNLKSTMHGKNGYNKLYKILRDIPYDKPFSIDVTIFWIHGMTPAFYGRLHALTRYA